LPAKKFRTFPSRMVHCLAAFFICARLSVLVVVAGFWLMRAAQCGERTVGAESMTTENNSSPLAMRPYNAAKALGISPRLLWQLTKDGAVPCVRVGSGKRKTILYPVAELQAWLAQQAQAGKGVQP
jgi:hypothetical protein